MGGNKPGEGVSVGGGGRGGVGGPVVSPGPAGLLYAGYHYSLSKHERSDLRTQPAPPQEGQVSGSQASSSTWQTTGEWGLGLVCGALVTRVLSIPAAAGVKRP